jgi:hypothetical protein
MRARLVSLVVRPTAPPLSVGLVIAASLIIAETLVLYPLKVVAPESALGVVYLAGRGRCRDRMGAVAGGGDVCRQRLGLRLLPYPPVFR